jgi:hypothetical protein
MTTSTKEELKSILLDHVAMVKFTKTDGTEREMRCTLISHYIPQTVSEETIKKSTKSENPDVLAVWDVDSDGWRSFKLDSILSVKVESEVDGEWTFKTLK